MIARFTVASLLALTAMGCGSSLPPVVLGHVASFTGPDKAQAEQAANGIKLALEDETAEPATVKLARGVAVRHADDRGDLETCEGQAVRLAALNRALILLGGDDVGEASRMGKAGVPVLSPIGFRSKSLGEAVFITGLSPTQRSQALAKYLNDKVKTAQIALVIENASDEIPQLDRAFSQAWKDAKGITRHEIQGATPETLEKLGTEISKQATPVFLGSTQAFEAFANHPAFRDRTVGFLGAELTRQSYKDRKAPLYLVTAFAVDKQTPKTEDFAKRYEAKFKTPAEPHAALAYDDARLAIESLKKGTLPPIKLAETLQNLKDFTGLTGTYTFVDQALVRPAFVGRFEGGVFADVDRVVP